MPLTDPPRKHLLARVLHAPGLMPLLMKQRNGTPWTEPERRTLRNSLWGLRRAAPYLIALALPGGLLLLPALAWWLDRRRGPRTADTAKAEQRA